MKLLFVAALHSAHSVSDRCAPIKRPPPLRTDGSNAFARHSMAVRVPGIIREVRVRNPDYPPSIQDSLSALGEEISGDGPIRLFDPPAPDHDLWRGIVAPHLGESWLDTDWFFAEMLSYRLLIDAVRYWQTGRDPFGSFKNDEMASDSLWSILGETLAFGGPQEAVLERTILQMLWGNRIDLSLSAVAAKGIRAEDEHLLADDIANSIEHLLRSRPADVHLIMDNAGTEQAIDLAFADLLFSNGLADRVVMHVKMHPVLVSDVIAGDVYALLDEMSARGGEFSALSERVRSELDRGRLRIVPDFFWNTAGCFWELPPRLRGPLSRADLLVAKGDVNYRRLTNDALWPPDISFTEALADVDLNLLALRTLKSDTLVGVHPEIHRRLDDEHGESWRTSGDYGVAQFHAGAA